MTISHNISYVAGDQTFSVSSEDTEKLLHSGLRNNVPLSYQCATGTCGTCAATLLKGKVNPGWNKNLAVATDESDTSGIEKILLCQAQPLSDCLIEIENILAENIRPEKKVQHFKAKIIDFNECGSNLYSLTVRLNELINYNPGQFLLLSLEGVEGYRAYSISDYNENTNTIKLIISRAESGGLSPLLTCKSVIGKTLSAFGAVGTAYIANNHHGDLAILVGGSGISTGLAIIDWAKKSKYIKNNKIYLFWGVRDGACLSLLAPIRQAVTEFQGQLTIIICTPVDYAALMTEYPEFTFDSALVPKAAIDHIENWKDLTAYIAGPAPMIQATVKTLVKKTDIDISKIKFDSFS